MSIKIPQLYDLKTTLATMKTAKKRGVNMNIWDRDIKAVEEAIAALEAIRGLPVSNGMRSPE